MPSDRPLRVVIADDEPDMRDYFRKILPRLGHQVLACAQNGQELIDQCRTFHPDLVITDIKMPDIDGIDAATQIYRDGPIPVILVSAFPDDVVWTESLQAGALDVFPKPIQGPSLVRTLLEAGEATRGMGRPIGEKPDPR
jgi:two-component system, response regulator PdtaR